MKDLYISACAASNIGKRRENNEDNFYLDDKLVNSENEAFAKLQNVSELITAVCDGMGGEEAGEVASQIAVETIRKFKRFILHHNFSDASIEKYVNCANELICDEIRKRRKQIGTTYTLLGIKKNIVTASNVGDSRIYRFSEGILKQISRDHTAAQSMVDAGIITKEESTKIPEKHQLTQHLGIFPYDMIIEPYTVRIPAKAKDKYLLCSDGLTDMLTDAEISDILSKNEPIEGLVDELIQSAVNKGGKDNVTVVLCTINDEEIQNK
ncbi:MAG: PP2C family protein-serine/threonine phosphatase [Acutalibacteraceae bacterium]